MDREQYIWEGNRQLLETNYHFKLDKPIYLGTIPKVQEILQKLYVEKFINAKQKTYLMGDAELSRKSTRNRKSGTSHTKFLRAVGLSRIVSVRRILELSF